MASLMKQLIKNIIPPFIIYLKTALPNYYYDLQLYYKYSASMGLSDRTMLLARIIKMYHAIEKGLTMPEVRLGFGRKNLISLMILNERFIKLYGNRDTQIQHSVAVILEYKVFHEKQGYKIDEELKSLIDTQVAKIDNLSSVEQKSVTSASYFQHSNSSFSDFSRSRASVRNYSEQDVPIGALTSAVDLARSAPSVCNRQTAKAYIISNKEKINEILAIQGGNRGFGHLTNKLIVITAELGVFAELSERNQAYIDGGIFAMNVLYGLHSNKVAACIMNCSHTYQKDLKMRTATGIKKSEVFIAMVSCGLPKENFKIALSKRKDLEDYLTILE
jgi:nitroreductase